MANISRFQPWMKGILVIVPLLVFLSAGDAYSTPCSLRLDVEMQMTRSLNGSQFSGKVFIYGEAYPVAEDTIKSIANSIRVRRVGDDIDISTDLTISNPGRLKHHLDCREGENCGKESHAASELGTPPCEGLRHYVAIKSSSVLIPGTYIIYMADLDEICVPGHEIHRQGGEIELGRYVVGGGARVTAIGGCKKSDGMWSLHVDVDRPHADANLQLEISETSMFKDCLGVDSSLEQDPSGDEYQKMTWWMRCSDSPESDEIGIIVRGSSKRTDSVSTGQPTVLNEQHVNAVRSLLGEDKCFEVTFTPN